jgi:hypothetical protein
MIMDRIKDIHSAEKKVLSDIKEFLDTVRKLADDVDSLATGIGRLRAIRNTVYENLNQIQHEYLILQGIRWLQGNGYGDSNLEWHWNPRQTGDANEPDIRGIKSNRIVLCGEATSSEKPSGVIDTRMRDTLVKLSRMEGEKFYFVQTNAMAERARTKVNNNKWQIKVIQI